MPIYSSVNTIFGMKPQLFGHRGLHHSFCLLLKGEQMIVDTGNITSDHHLKMGKTENVSLDKIYPATNYFPLRCESMPTMTKNVSMCRRRGGAPEKLHPTSNWHTWAAATEILKINSKNSFITWTNTSIKKNLQTHHLIFQPSAFTDTILCLQSNKTIYFKCIMTFRPYNKDKVTGTSQTFKFFLLITYIYTF